MTTVRYKVGEKMFFSYQQAIEYSKEVKEEVVPVYTYHKDADYIDEVIDDYEEEE